MSRHVPLQTEAHLAGEQLPLRTPAESWPSWLVGFYRFACAAVFVIFFLACFHGLANFWQWGHNGFTGAAFSQAARNSIRFGVIGQAPYYTGLEPPGPAQLYTHHPMMIHAHLVALYGLLGFHEWAGRLVPALYSFFTLVLIFAMVRKLRGRVMALASITLYALVPIDLIYANMIDHEQGGIFWCLAFVLLYMLWLREPKRRLLLLALLAQTVAIQFDWPGYYLSFFVAAHALATGIARSRGMLRWRPEYAAAVLVSAVALLNALVFFSWIAAVQGGLGDIMTAFSIRSMDIPGYAGVLYYHTLDLQGALPMLLLGCWALIFIVRLAMRRLKLIDVVPAFFILIQVVHSAVFKQAGLVHAYWTYYLSPAIAVGGADVLVSLARVLKRAAARVCLSLGGRFARQPAPSLGYALVFLAVFFPPLVFQTRFARAQFRWGMATGAASYVQPYDDQYGEILWARELAKRYGRSGVRYFIDRSVRGRIEFLYYLDAPYEDGSMLTFALKKIDPAVRNVMLVDLRYCTARSILSSMVGRYRTFIWGRRFIAVEAAPAEKNGPRGFVSLDLPSPLWWRWLVNPVRPPVTWGPDPDPASLASIFEPALKLTARPVTGGPGGAPEEWDCPRGSVMSVISTTLSKTQGAGMLVGSLRPACRRIALDVKKGVFTPRSGALAGGPWFGSWTGMNETTVGCKAGDLPVGIYAYLHQGAWIPGAGLLCSSVRVSGSGSGGGWGFIFSKPYRTKTSGLEVGKVTELLCPEGSVAWGFQGRAGDLVDAVGVSCVKLGDVLMTPWGEGKKPPGL